MAIQIETKRIADLRAADYNPRADLKPGDYEYERLKQSIREYGNVGLVVWNKRTGNVVGGHQRLKALKDLGETTVRVSVVDLPEKDEKSLNLALNKIRGDWDEDMLREIMTEFDRSELEITGFSQGEIATLLSDVSAGIADFCDNMSGSADFDFSGTFGGDDDDEDGGDDEDGDVDLEAYDQKWVVTLKFDDRDAAGAWAHNNGYDLKVNERAASAILRPY